MIVLFLLIIFLALAFCFICAITLKLFIDSKNKKGDRGVKFSLPHCPVCEVEFPFFQTPNAMHQASWGGWTCQNCGCELNKLENEIQERKESLIENKPIEDFRSFYDKDGKTPLEKVFEEDKG